MAPKTMVVSYNQIGKLPAGRYKEGNAVAYSCNPHLLEDAEAITSAIATGSLNLVETVCDAQRQAAEVALSHLQEEMVNDLENVEIVYIYVGMSAMDGTFIFIQKLKGLGKEVHMLACDCDSKEKIDFANKLGIDITWVYCGGQRECGKIFEAAAAQ